MTLTPLVAGPDVIPVLTDPERARAHPWLAVLSALAHHSHPDSAEVLKAFLNSLEPLNPERGALYIDIVRAGLPQPARQNLEDLMSTGRYEFQSDFARYHTALGREEGRLQGETLGKALGEANAIVTVLVTRGLKVTDAVRKQITDCSDPRQLTAWLKRAISVARAEDIFTERPEPRP